MQTKVTANTNKHMSARRKQHTLELIDSHTWQTNTQTQNKHTPPFFLNHKHYGSKKHAVNYNLGEQSKTMYLIKT